MREFEPWPKGFRVRSPYVCSLTCRHPRARCLATCLRFDEFHLKIKIYRKWLWITASITTKWHFKLYIKVCLQSALRNQIASRFHWPQPSELRPCKTQAGSLTAGRFSVRPPPAPRLPGPPRCAAARALWLTCSASPAPIKTVSTQWS